MNKIIILHQACFRPHRQLLSSFEMKTGHMSAAIKCVVTTAVLGVALGSDPLSAGWETFLEQGDLEKQHVQYKISEFNSSFDYFNAQSYCLAFGGYLAEPKSKEEMEVLRVIIQEAGPRNNWWIGARLSTGHIFPCFDSKGSFQPAHYDWVISQTKSQVIKRGQKEQLSELSAQAHCVPPYQLDKNRPIQKTGGYIWARTGRLVHKGFWPEEDDYKTRTENSCVKISHEWQYNWAPEDCLKDESGNLPIRALCERRLVATRMSKDEIESLFRVLNCYGCGERPSDELDNRRRKCKKDNPKDSFINTLANVLREGSSSHQEKIPSVGDHVYLPSSFVIYFDGKKCDLKSKSQAHGLAINIRFVLTNYDWLRRMFSSNPKKDIGDLRISHAARCQKGSDRTQESVGVSHVFYETLNYDFALVVSSENIFHTQGLRTSPICITPYDEANIEKLELVEIVMAESATCQPAKLYGLPTRPYCAKGMCRLRKCMYVQKKLKRGTTLIRQGIVAATFKPDHESKNNRLLLVGLMAEKEDRVSSCSKAPEFKRITHETLVWIHSVHQWVMSRVEDDEEFITCLHPESTLIA